MAYLLVGKRVAGQAGSIDEGSSDVEVVDDKRPRVCGCVEPDDLGGDSGEYGQTCRTVRTAHHPESPQGAGFHLPTGYLSAQTGRYVSEVPGARRSFCEQQQDPCA